MSVLASMFLVGCSQEELTSNSETISDGDTRYLSVNIMSSDVTTRATNGGYEDGTTEENKVEKIRFYFFTESGAPANVKPNGESYINYYDWEPKTEDVTDDDKTPNVSKKLGATIVISTQEGDKLPRQIAAVINPTWETGKGDYTGSVSLQQLKDAVNDYAKSDLTQGGKFVMFNSVYKSTEGTEACAIPIESENLAKSESNAKNHPVKIYVERCVAKVTVEFGQDVSNAVNGKLALKTYQEDPTDATKKIPVDLKVNDEQVYLQIKGWRLTAETDEGRLGKEIKLSWKNDSWINSPTSFRSCWAINSPNAENRYSYSYNNINTNPTALYTNENAEDYTNNNNETKNLNRTKVIIAGQLCKEVVENGETKLVPFTIVRHMGSHFPDDETANFPALRTNILRQLSTYVHYYYDSNEIENGKPVRKQIGADDLQIVIAGDVKKEDSETNCYVYAQLTNTAESKTWYDSPDENANKLENAATTINAALKNKEYVDKALVWNKGMTYYYYEIIHHGSGETATKGVVRNHVYKTKITDIAGLGTPVYDPTKIIYPEKPGDKEYYIAAEVDILAWHIVNEDYKLEW